MNLELHADDIYINKLDTARFARMLDDSTQCYKFYWLEAVVNLMLASEEDISFDQVINEMICEAWYTVTTYHLHLGPTILGKSENYLEHAINIVNSGLQSCLQPSKEDIVRAIAENEDALANDKSYLTRYVPYRLLSSFLDQISGNDPLWNRSRQLISYIEDVNRKTPVLYTIIDGRGLQKKIRINPYWRQLVQDNYPVIVSWIQLKKIHFLQDRNPGVPGIIYKLNRENEATRKLANARELWKSVTDKWASPIHDIYSGHEIDVRQSDLDHFVPWSFIANDELWNLIPMEKKLNSSKSNHLPDWDVYFSRMAALQYHMYTTVFCYPEVRALFEKCRRDNLNALWASEGLYIEGNSEEQFTNILEHNLKPLYDTAHLQGYDLWKYAGTNPVNLS